VDAWSADELRGARAAGGGLYHEYLRRSAMSCGIYVLEAGAEDPQTPHGEDEIYHVLDGRATVEVDGEQRPVGPGDTIFVGARVPHRFHSIERRLELLVLFAPAETG
jgi:mannose-6-phosphate isomerase-like protein (cupin superfamily)